MSITAGEGPGGYRAPAAGETVRVPVDLWDWIGVKLGGVTYDQVTVTVKKEGAASPTSWTAWATENWVPVLNTDGLARYEVVFSGDDATEVALLDTPGSTVLSVVCDEGHGETEFRVNVWDTSAAVLLRAWDDLITAELPPHSLLRVLLQVSGIGPFQETLPRVSGRRKMQLALLIDGRTVTIGGPVEWDVDETAPPFSGSRGDAGGD